MPTVKQIFDAIEKELVRQLAAKTNWGRKEVMEAFLKAKADAAMKLFDKETAT
jgi:hypothetical protein